MSKKIFIVFFCALFGTVLGASGFPEDYYKIKEIKVRKERFVEILLPVIAKENLRILEERETIKSFFAKDFFILYDSKLRRENLSEIVEIAEKYDVKNLFDKEAYLKKIDIIPPSLALSQAALESAWGRSGYARKMNNLYGHYSYKKKHAGKKVRGRRSKIRIFKTLNEAVEAYMHNLNTHWAYKDFREARQGERLESKLFAGPDVTPYLTRYSIIRERYTIRLNRVIRDNQFVFYDMRYAEQKAESTQGDYLTQTMLP